MAIDDGGVSLELLRQMLNANDPEEVARHAREWKSLASELYEIAPEVDRIIADLGDSFDSQHAGPAFRAKLADAVNDLDVTAGRVDRNGSLVIQAADAWRRARDVANNANSDSDAQPIRSALSDEHAAIAAQLDLFDEVSRMPGPTPDENSSGSGGAGAGFASDSGSRDGGGFVPPVSNAGRGNTQPVGRFGPGPSLGGQTSTAGGKLGQGAGSGRSDGRLGAGTGGSAAGAAARGAGARGCLVPAAACRSAVTGP